ncbi:MAG: hypothetical protein KDA79_03080, partial [Planctomycetaceae bacterium]|nr:hypothetical protein [Planctomycetaceae bacterium]
MHLYRALWTALLLPAALWGGTLGVCVWVFTGELQPAAIAAVTSLSTAALIGTLARRSLREALALVRHGDVLGLTNQQSGLWTPLTSAARDLAESLESQVQEAVEERNQLEARYQVIRRQLTRMEAALHSIDDPVLICDGRQDVKFANWSARNLLQSTSPTDAATGSATNCDYSHMTELARLISETIARHRATPRRTADFVLPAREEGTAPQAWRAIATSLIDDSQIPLGLSVILQDNSQEHHDRTRHAEFVSSVCHELKTPLASIQAFTEMLIDGDVETPEEQA